jgi:hypothetical protein
MAPSAVMLVAALLAHQRPVRHSSDMRVAACASLDGFGALLSQPRDASQSWRIDTQRGGTSIQELREPSVAGGNMRGIVFGISWDDPKLVSEPTPQRSGALS